jgi:pyridoxal phosphate enzyme (YggS family)
MTSDPMTSNTVAARLAEVRERIAAAASAAGRAPDDVTLVAVSKAQPATAVAAAAAAGQRVFGENYGQELLAKAEAPELADFQIAWHFIGAVQRNKVSGLGPYVALWHTVDRVRLAATIARQDPGEQVLVQVNVGDDPAKAGCTLAEAPRLVDEVAAAGLVPVGLMTIPPLDDEPRPHFAALKQLADRLGLAHTSMGMSADFEVAVAEGATLVRIGGAIFGARTAAARLQR